MVNSRTKSMACCVSLVVILLCVLLSSVRSSNHFDPVRYDEGKKEYALMQDRSQLPRYGICWKNAMARIETGCKRLTDEVQSRLALAYLNCLLALQGREVYECDDEVSIQQCTQAMQDVDRGSLTTMFTHTQNICYFLQAQIWNEEMDSTIDRLSNSSSFVGKQLEESVKIQMDMIHQQNESLRNQQQIIKQALDLRLLINDVFEKVSKLQTLVLGEFSGFYSIIYYTFSIILCYLLTSTARTSGARFWLFGVMTVNMLLEQLVIIYTPHILIIDFPVFSDEEELIFWFHKSFRKVSASVAIVILLIFAAKYKDIQLVNSQLLMEIKKQNSDIKKMFVGAGMSPPTTSQKAFDQPDSSTVKSAPADTTIQEGSSVSGYSSDTASSSISDSDRTFSLHEDADVEADVDDDQSSSHYETESDVTTVTNTEKESLLNELNDLRNSTPIRQMTNHLSSWINTGYYSSAKNNDIKDIGTGSSTDIRPEPRYNLRPRRGRNETNSLVDFESPTAFHKEVKRLEKISHRNNKRSQTMVNKMKNLSLLSDDD